MHLQLNPSYQVEVRKDIHEFHAVNESFSLSCILPVLEFLRKVEEILKFKRQLFSFLWRTLPLPRSGLGHQCTGY